MRLHDWSGFAALGAGAFAVLELARGSYAWASGWLLVAVVTAAVTRYWSIKYPSVDT